jgi:uncharacterized protein DUF1569
MLHPSTRFGRKILQETEAAQFTGPESTLRRFDDAIIFGGQPKQGGIMKNLFERDALDEVISRVNALKPETPRQWGKMDVAQMMAHCSAALDMAASRLNPPRIFIGRLIGPIVKPIYWNEKPFSRSSPTDKKLVVSDQRDFSREQDQLKRCIRLFHEGGEAKCTTYPHPFFGALTP